MAVVIMQEFNTDMYNTVCMLSSTMGVLGAIYQVILKKIFLEFSGGFWKLIFFLFFFPDTTETNISFGT